MTEPSEYEAVIQQHAESLLPPHDHSAGECERCVDDEVIATMRADRARFDADRAAFDAVIAQRAERFGQAWAQILTAATELEVASDGDH